MLPTLRHGDLAVLRQEPQYHIGDIIAYRMEQGVVIHRLVGGSTEDGFVTQGDNRDTPDAWLPVGTDVLGSVWFSVRGAGTVLYLLRQPRNLYSILGLALLLMMGKGSESRGARRRGRRRAASAPLGLIAVTRLVIGPQRGPGHVALLGRRGTSIHTGGGGIVAMRAAGLGILLSRALTATGIASLLCAVLAAYAYVLPAETDETVERTSYQHSGSFSYTVEMRQSSLYPSGKVESPSVVSPGDSEASGPAVAARLAENLHLTFVYELISEQHPDVSGELAYAIEISAGNGLKRTDSLRPAESFGGSSSVSEVDVDIASLLALIDQIEQETGFSPGAYEVRIIPTVRVQGQVGTDLVSGTFSPAFTMGVTRTTISLDPQLQRTQPVSALEHARRPRVIALARIQIPVALARSAALLATAVCLALTVAAALGSRLIMGRSEAASIAMRYGALLMPVAEADLSKAHVIRVGSVNDLARLAQRDGRLIFQTEPESGGPLYFVHDGQIAYTYEASSGVQR